MTDTSSEQASEKIVTMREATRVGLRSVTQAFLEHCAGNYPVFVLATLDADGKATTLVSVHSGAIAPSLGCLAIANGVVQACEEASEKLEGGKSHADHN